MVGAKLQVKPGRRSVTSDLVAATRALYTQGPPALATVDDPAAYDLVARPVAWLLRSAQRVPFGSALLERAAARASLGVTYGVPLRTAVIDDAVRASMQEGVRQLVLLGAGLDGRAWRMPELEHCVVFEVDHPDTQAHKRERVRLAALADEVRYAGIDFERQTLGDVLAEVGHTPDRPTIWVWEGVTMYLTRDAVLGTLDAVARLSAPGSRLCLTYVPEHYGPTWARPLGGALARLVGEPLRSTWTAAELADQLATRGLAVETDTGPAELALKYWPPARQHDLPEWERTLIAHRP